MVSRSPACTSRTARDSPGADLMLDVCRHWMPVEVVKRNLDAMAAVKLNVLHWHLSEDQGFRVESKRYPAAPRIGIGRRLLHAGPDSRHRGLRPRPRHPRDPRVRRAGPQRRLVSPVIRNWPPRPDRSSLGGRRRLGDGPVEGEHLRIPRRLHRRDDAALPRSLLPHRRRRSESRAPGTSRPTHSGFRQRARAEGRAPPSRSISTSAC